MGREPPDNEPQKITVPCGKCSVCRSKHRDEWFMRIKLESHLHPSNFFVTLTYDDSFLKKNSNGVVSHCYEDVQKAFKLFRKRYCPFRYVLISEYGPNGTHRPHYHFVFFCDVVGLDEYDVLNMWEDVWPYGFVTSGELVDGRIGYVANYCIPDLQYVPSGATDNIFRVSRDPSIGYGFLTEQLLDRFHRVDRDGNFMQYVVLDGKKFNLPRVWQDSLYCDADKDKKFFKSQKDASEYYEKMLLQFGSDEAFNDYCRLADILMREKWLQSKKGKLQI